MTNSAITRTPQQPAQGLAVFSRTEREPGTITAMLKRAELEYHLISPASSCGALPEGFAVSFSSVLVNVGADTYETKNGGKRGLHRHVLDRIASAAAVSWDSHRSRRIDDGRDPRYVMFCAVGHYRHFDGTEVEISGTKEMDLREGSAQIAGKSEKEIAMQRSHILAHAETKARLRAIAAMGIKRAYTADELKKPFVVARVMFTGQTSDPDLRREFAMMQARSFTASKAAMYGTPVPRLSLPPRSPAPPVSGSVYEDDESAPALPEAEAAASDAPAPAEQP
jgi:hypothetical protein